MICAAIAEIWVFTSSSTILCGKTIRRLSAKPSASDFTVKNINFIKIIKKKLGTIDYKAMPSIFLRALLLSRLGFRRPLGVPESSNEFAPNIP